MAGQDNRRIPPIRWLGSYEREWLPAGVLAGLTTAAVVIPKAMAYATIAGLPVQIGLYTAFVPVLIYASLGTSRPLSVSSSETESRPIVWNFAWGQSVKLQTAAKRLALVKE